MIRSPCTSALSMSLFTLPPGLVSSLKFIRDMLLSSRTSVKMLNILESSINPSQTPKIRPCRQLHYEVLVRRLHDLGKVGRIGRGFLIKHNFLLFFKIKKHFVAPSQRSFLYRCFHLCHPSVLPRCKDTPWLRWERKWSGSFPQISPQTM